MTKADRLWKLLYNLKPDNCSSIPEECIVVDQRTLTDLFEVVEKNVEAERLSANNPEIIRQINDSPFPLKNYIHGLETGSIADLVLQNQKLIEENQEMKAVLERQRVK